MATDVHCAVLRSAPRVAITTHHQARHMLAATQGTLLAPLQPWRVEALREHSIAPGSAKIRASLRPGVERQLPELVLAGSEDRRGRRRGSPGVSTSAAWGANLNCCLVFMGSCDAACQCGGPGLQPRHQLCWACGPTLADHSPAPPTVLTLCLQCYCWT